MSGAMRIELVIKPGSRAQAVNVAEGLGREEGADGRVTAEHPAKREGSHTCPGGSNPTTVRALAYRTQRAQSSGRRCRRSSIRHDSRHRSSRQRLC